MLAPAEGLALPTRGNPRSTTGSVGLRSIRPLNQQSNHTGSNFLMLKKSFNVNIVDFVLFAQKLN